MDDLKIGTYRSNSNSVKKAESEQEKKIVNKAVSGKVHVKKRSEWQKLADIFIAEDVGSVKAKLIEDVIVPSIQKLLMDMVSNGLSMIFYGTTAKSSSNGMNASRVSYSSYYNGGNSNQQRQPATANRYAYEDIVLDSKDDAENVLSQMFALLDKYGNVSINDLYDLLGIDGGDYTDTHYGWKDLSSSNTIRVPDGYKLKLPKVVPLPHN